MLCIDIEPNEVEWIKNAILNNLENVYRGVQPDRSEIINSPMEKFGDMPLEEWQTIHTLYEKLRQ